jgi:hypothetical protein
MRDEINLSSVVVWLSDKVVKLDAQKLMKEAI